MKITINIILRYKDEEDSTESGEKKTWFNTTFLI